MAETVSFLDASGTVFWESHPGPQTTALLSDAFEVLYGGARGGGKLSPVTSLVCTPKGFKKLGDLKVGDTISDPTSGGTTTVIAVHPQGLKKIWKLTFDDGASLEVGEDHLWAYRLANHHKPRTKASAQRDYAVEQLAGTRLSNRWDLHKVGKTKDIIAHFEAGEGVRIPLTEPVAFTKSWRKRTQVSPYIIGLFLGDGYLDSARITNVDPEIHEHLVGLGYTVGEDGKTLAAHGQHRRTLRLYFSNHKLLKCRAWEKFIPESLKEGSLEERLEVVRGLMDTDGTVDERGRCYYCSTSEQMAKDFQWIVRSLGGKARIRTRTTKFTSKDELKEGRVSYNVRIWHHKLSSFFKLSRKIARCTDSWNGGAELSRELVGVDYIGEKDSRCITVSNPYGLYIADDFVVTHNSAALIAWLSMGNRSLPPEHPCHASYLNHKGFRALVLRRDATDLKEFVSEAQAFFSHFGLVGGKSKDDPPIFKFPSGATIYTNHLQSENATEKYKGWSLHKIGIEELTLVESQRTYLKVLGSIRSVYPEIKPQIFCTTNPDGNGSAWVRKRFVSVLGGNDKMIPWGTKMRDPISGMTRIFIPAKLKDNPSLGADYHSMLLMQDAKTRKAWLDGDWYAMTGAYFSGFRPNGPHDGEPPEARHVIQTNENRLMPWWPRYIGVDWGFKHNAAAYWLCNNQDDERLHVYRELVQSGLGAEQLGAKIAHMTIPDLVGQPDMQIPLYLSHDAFNKVDVTKTRAELIQTGIEQVLGIGTTILLGNGSNILAPDGDELDIAQTFDNDARIVIHRAGKERIGVWQELRRLLRFTPLVSVGEPDPAYARTLLEGPDGFNRYETYLSSFQKQREVLPGILIWDNCPRLIEALQSAIHDENKPEDVLEDGKIHSNDELDALRHALMMMRKFQNSAPYKAYMAQRLKQAEKYNGDPNLMAQVYRKADNDYRDTHATGNSFNLTRASQRRVN